MAAYQSPELPWWFEAYQDSTVLVAYVANYDSVYHSKPEAQLFFMHQLVQQLDAVVLKSENRLWRMHAFSLPFYCVLCPQCNSPDHANLVFDVALELAVAASKVSLPCGDPVDLRLGMASGRSSAGVVGATGVTFVVTGKIAQGAKHYAEHTHYLTASEDTWRKLNAANKARGQWRRSALFAIPSIGPLPCFDYHPAAPAPPAPAPPPAAELRYTIADISDEFHRLEHHPPAALPWHAYTHPGIEVAYRRWLMLDPTPLHRVVVLLCLVVLMSTQLRVIPQTAERPMIAARLACAALPFLALLLHGVMRRCGLLAHEAAWVVVVLARKALCLYPNMAQAAHGHSSAMLPHMADLLDCVLGLVAFKARPQLQAACCLWAWAVSMLWVLLQLQSGAVDALFTLSTWMFGTLSLVVQAWLMSRWELHKRRSFLRLVAIDSAAKPRKGAAPRSLLRAGPAPDHAPSCGPSSSSLGACLCDDDYMGQAAAGSCSKKLA